MTVPKTKCILGRSPVKTSLYRYSTGGFFNRDRTLGGDFFTTFTINGPGDSQPHVSTWKLFSSTLDTCGLELLLVGFANKMSLTLFSHMNEVKDERPVASLRRSRSSTRCRAGSAMRTTEKCPRGMCLCTADVRPGETFGF